MLYCIVHKMCPDDILRSQEYRDLLSPTSEMLTPSFVQTIVWFGFVGTYARYLVPFIMSYDFNNVLATASDPFFVFVNDYCRDCMFAIIVACAVML